MTDTVTVRGYIATAPTQKYLPKTNIPLANFRLASTPRWFDNSTGQWRESDTNWYTVNCFRALAHNSARSLHVGQPILVTGRLKVKQFERSDGSQGTSIEIDASSIGHDLNFGIARFERVSDRRPEAGDVDKSFEQQVEGERQLAQTQVPTSHGSARTTIPEVSHAVNPSEPISDRVQQLPPNFGLSDAKETDDAALSVTT
ncbi:single-stranded DNA-binding protein [Rothia endophytica]|uniref:single-stranded DNA-binding protein n=1 Tax=Rothia endophytica TaxID=1324766 RepID=UPI001F025E84|nr:single-stranded DNA-binding protein [Rothia endophytica]